MLEIDIGELAKKVGLTTSAIRFYESKGLIQSIGRKGLRRQYPEFTIQTLALIKTLKNGGLTLKEIEEIFIKKYRINVDRDYIKSKRFELEQQMIQLKKLLKMLNHIQNCPYENHLNCPNFIKILDL